MNEINYEYYCLRCKYYDNHIGVCEKFKENVREYPAKFHKICNGEHFVEDVNSPIDESISKYIKNYSIKTESSFKNVTAKKQINLSGITNNQFIVLTTEIIESFKWVLLYVKENELKAVTDGKGNNCLFYFNISAHSILIRCEDKGLNISKKYVEENIEKFLEKYYEVLKYDLCEVENVGRTVDIKDSGEVDNYVSKLVIENPQITYKIKNSYVTLSLITINVTIFALINLLYFNVSNAFESWGASQKYVYQDEQWWRLITSLIIHNDIFHLISNMVVLFIFGNIVEPIIGHLKFLFLYLIIGLISCLAAINYSSSETISIGASGAIFGILGVYFIYLLSSLFKRRTRKVYQRDFIIFLVYSVLVSFKPGISWVAHLVGLFMGFITGYIVIEFIKRNIKLFKYE